ncbi:MAG: SDR family oxidoreductase [Bacteroidales bacterium]|jgi:NAD(P)-dependent dehydrogenase (short-subunit alcohol dehydrogenase family)|nr:SDR family oxidoreductase [Bacteroidales bacterium]MCI2121476.1 SDR family oxidoreductase [Bacteroidales bacterium]MCI2145273.1 SDR family oxidoreductase [Bacteroidales bacterium]
MKNQIILLTGASSGFGKASAEALAERGHIVYGTSRRELPSGKVRMLKLDVTDRNSCKAAAKQVIDEQGRIDVLINNAGIGIGGAVELATPEEMEKQMGTNFGGCVNMCNAVLPYMRAARCGKIISFSSIAGVMSIPFQGFYSASKYAIEGYSLALNMEVHPFGIKVCVIEPGDFATNFTSSRINSQATLEDKDYGPYFKRALVEIEKEENNGCKPSMMAKAVCRIVERRNPKFHNKVGEFLQVSMARCSAWMPLAWVQRGLRFYYKID